MAADIKELVTFMAKALVEKPDDVQVTLVEERSQDVYELEVADADLGKVIGRGGKTAESMRAVVSAAGRMQNKRATVEILE